MFAHCDSFFSFIIDHRLIFWFLSSTHNPQRSGFTPFLSHQVIFLAWIWRNREGILIDNTIPLSGRCIWIYANSVDARPIRVLPRSSSRQILLFSLDCYVDCLVPFVLWFQIVAHCLRRFSLVRCELLQGFGQRVALQSWVVFAAVGEDAPSFNGDLALEKELVEHDVSDRLLLKPGMVMTGLGSVLSHF